MAPPYHQTCQASRGVSASYRQVTSRQSLLENMQQLGVKWAKNNKYQRIKENTAGKQENRYATGGHLQLFVSRLLSCFKFNGRRAMVILLQISSLLMIF